MENNEKPFDEDEFLKEKVKKSKEEKVVDSERFYYILTYDKEENSADPREEIKKLIDKNDGKVAVCPDRTTILFVSHYDKKTLLKNFYNSDLMKPISYSLYPIGKNMSSGIINEPNGERDDELMNQDYHPNF